MTSRPALLAALWPLLAATGNCADPAENRPPPITETVAPPIATSCSTLRDADLHVEGTALLIDEIPADCAAEGLLCPLEQREDWRVAAGCNPSEAVSARCSASLRWTLLCETAPVGAGGAPP